MGTRIPRNPYRQFKRGVLSRKWVAFEHWRELVREYGQWKAGLIRATEKRALRDGTPENQDDALEMLAESHMASIREEIRTSTY